MSTTTFRKEFKTRFGGTLYHGKHSPDGQACALEAASVIRTGRWTDSPLTAGLPDLRPLNDGLWSSDAVRTKALVPVIEALWDWSTWTKERQQDFAKRVAARIIGEVLPIALDACGLTDAADKCRKERSESAARAARSAADKVLILAARIWKEEAVR